MPISDYLLSLALALHPAAVGGGAVVLGPDALVQPAGGVVIQRDAMGSVTKVPSKTADKTSPLHNAKGATFTKGATAKPKRVIVKPLMHIKPKPK